MTVQTLASTSKGRKFPAEPLTPEEVRALLDAVSGSGPLAVRNRALISTLWRGGLRVSEAISLYPRDLDAREGTVRVRRGKGQKTRVAVIDSEALAYLAVWEEVRKRLGLNGHHPLFCSVADGSGGKGVRKPGRPLNSAYLRRLLPKLAEQAAIEKRVHPHGLRHSHATELVSRGVPLHVIAGQLGHRSTATTDAYLQKLTPTQRIAVMREAGWTLDGG